MKYCEEYAALLDLFVDGELPPEEMERVQAHLAACPGCQAYVDDALAIRAGFPDVEDTAVPEGFAEGVMARVREESGRERKIVELRRRSFRRWAGTLGTLAACCALVILMRTGFTGRGSDSAAMVTASVGGSAAPADYAADTNGMDEDAAARGIAPRMVMEPVEAPETAAAEEEDAAEERLEVHMAMAAGGDNEADQECQGEKAASPAAVSPAGMSGVSGDVEAALCLSAEEAGDRLAEFAVVWENAAERHYELNTEEYRELLETLGRQEELPEGKEGPFLVIVAGPLE